MNTPGSGTARPRNEPAASDGPKKEQETELAVEPIAGQLASESARDVATPAEDFSLRSK
jgi:hypothetical protein